RRGQPGGQPQAVRRAPAAVVPAAGRRPAGACGRGRRFHARATGRGDCRGRERFRHRPAAAVGLALTQRAREAAGRAGAGGPEPLTQVGRRAYARISEATAGLRMEPAFILIGAQRCGTTSLFRALTAHPQVVPPIFRKGVNYFDLNYYLWAQWDRAHIPVTELASRRRERHPATV